MGAFFVYIVKSAVCLAVFYLFYRLLLSKETFHRFNRIALLSILLLSCVIPFIEVTVAQPTEVNQQFLTLEELLLMAELNNGAIVGTVEVAPVVTWREILLLCYLAGIAFFFFRNIWSLSRMLRLIKGSRILKQENGVTLITHQKDIAPFSWMKFVVISEKDMQENGEEILVHEYAHIEKHHSIDLLVADICIFFQWFNPASWLLKQELQNIHEYEADETVINKGIDAKKYQLLLIKKAVGTRLYSMANSFNHSSLKKRITMMIKEKSSPWARLKYLYVLPLAAVAMAAFARPEVSKEFNEISAVKVNDLTAIVKTEEVKSVENQPGKEVKVKGKVLYKDSKESVVGASVIIKGTTTGTITDLDGVFMLNMPLGATLRISYIDVATKEVVVTEKNAEKEIMVYLEKDGSAKKADDGIVVVGYGTQSNSGEVNLAESPVFQVVEEMPEFPGGMSECMKFLAKNIKYPVVSQENGSQGKVIVQFVIEKDGTVTTPEIVRSIDPYLDKEALRVICLMPRWKPGMQRGQAVRVKYTVPVTFKLTGGEVKKDSTLNISLKTDGLIGNIIQIRGIEKQPLIVVDGVEWTSTLDKLSPDNIESMSVLKNESATATYGEKGKNGVILITTKKK